MMELWHNYNAVEEYDYNFAWVSSVSDAELAHALRGVYTKHSSLNNSITRYKIGGGKYSKSYYDICCSFDIETSTYYIDDTPYSSMYVWQFGINNTVIMGHTYAEFLELLDRIQLIIKPKKSQRLLVAIHNESYEFAFIRNWLNLTESFLKEQRNPLTLEHNGFFVFIDTLAITQSTLKKLAETYCNTRKCVGDLDYNKLRFTDGVRSTELTRDELGYCHNDVLILCEFMRYYNDTYLANKLRPMTATGILNAEIKEEYEKFVETNPNHARRVRQGQPNEDEYHQLMDYCYRGGYVHGDMLFVGEELDGANHPIMGVDYTSSYPSVMLYRKYALSFKECTKIDDIDGIINYYHHDYASIFYITLYNIRNKTNHSIESKSKCIELEGARIDNGRVLSADKMTVYIDMLTLFNYMRFYEWDEYELWGVKVGKMEYLPPYLINPMLKYYSRKNELKRQGNEGIEYKLAKGKVNSFYGLTVKQKPTSRITYEDGDWIEVDALPYEEQCDNSFLSPYIGVFVSSWARYNLLQCVADLIEECGANCYYMDTDSIKTDDTPLTRAYIEKYNAEIKVMCEDAKKRTGATDLIDGLGEFDLEFGAGTKNGAIERLKYLGAKRYILTTDKGVNLQTIAGLPKGWIFDAVRDSTNEYYNCDAFKIFNDDMVAVGCKLASKYFDEEFEHEVTDYNGDKYIIYEKSCVSLVPTNFKLSLDEAWREMVLYMHANEARIR